MPPKQKNLVSNSKDYRFPQEARERLRKAAVPAFVDELPPLLGAYPPAGLEAAFQGVARLLVESVKWAALPHPPAKCRWKGKLDPWVYLMVNYSTLEGLRVFDTLEDAADFVKLERNGISRACNEWGRTCGGFRWFKIPRLNYSCTDCGSQALRDLDFYWFEGRRATPCIPCYLKRVAEGRATRGKKARKEARKVVRLRTSGK